MKIPIYYISKIFFMGRGVQQQQHPTRTRNTPPITKTTKQENRKQEEIRKNK